LKITPRQKNLLTILRVELRTNQRKSKNVGRLQKYKNLHTSCQDAPLVKDYKNQNYFKIGPSLP
jgi:hypothetical protein